jgi:hypothetical protein
VKGNDGFDEDAGGRKAKPQNLNPNPQKNKDGGLGFNDGDSFNEEFNSKARKQKLAELQKQKDGGLGVRGSEEFEGDEGGRKRK